MTGQPEDSQFIEKIEVSREYTLRDLKDVILSMKQMEFAKDFVRKYIYNENNIAFGIN
jgi:hypothetical protein